MRALIVEDSKAMRAIISHLFDELGVETVTAYDGKNALDILEQDSGFDLSVVDWNMPNMNGIDLIKAIRNDETLDHMKIMMCTTETEIERVVLALQSGANEYIMKPFTKEVLQEKLRILELLID